MNIAPSSASAAEYMKNLMTWEMVNLGPLYCGTGSSSARKIWDPAGLQPLDSLWNTEYECTERTILLVMYTIPSLG